ncbi:hypothetical protein [Microbispora sp. NPDC046933]|uniref:hypothetical protein n=1 Tax=Microbispora sp. NPDC046933 TaxID=3155618 RepID=UPI0033E81ABF
MTLPVIRLMMWLFMMGVGVFMAVARLVAVLVIGRLIRCRVMWNCHSENAS